MSLQRGINLRALAEKMGQCSGAEVRGICTEAGAFPIGLFSRIWTPIRFFFSFTGMYALRERRQHVTQEDFEFAIAKASIRSAHWLIRNYLLCYFVPIGSQEEPRRQHIGQQAFLIISSRFSSFHASLSSCNFATYRIIFFNYSYQATVKKRILLATRIQIVEIVGDLQNFRSVVCFLL